jgi:molybdopterin molybdotransferase
MRSVTLSYQQARETVLRVVRANRAPRCVEEAAIDHAAGRVLAEEIPADRDCPPCARSTRDGYALRAADVPGDLAVIGQVRAGRPFNGVVGPGQAVEIMTGAPVPAGADAVVMLEHVTAAPGRLRVDEPVQPGLAINPQASEAAAGEVVLRAGARLDYSGVAMLAAFGRERVKVFRRPTAAILSTGDEIVEAGRAPREFEIRDANAHALAAQVVRAGGEPLLLPVARDNEEHARAIVERGIAADLLLISGGVSAGKYDVVKRVLAGLGAEFFFDRVLIQPGQPLVFGRARGKFFFGLPGNPASAMVTFELFARAALDLLGGQREVPLALPFARLTREFRHKPGLTRFLPAKLSADGAEVTPVAWGGSGDIPALTRADAFLVADSARAQYASGDLIQVLLK